MTWTNQQPQSRGIPVGLQVLNLRERQAIAQAEYAKEYLRRQVMSGEMEPARAEQLMFRLKTHIDPLLQKKQMAEIEHMKAQDEKWQHDAAHAEIRLHQQSKFHGQMFGDRLQTYVDPETGEKHRYYLDRNGDPKAPWWETAKHERRMKNGPSDEAAKEAAARKAHDEDFDKLSKLYRKKNALGEDMGIDVEAIKNHRDERERNWKETKAAEQSKRAQAIDQQRQVDAAARLDKRTPEQVQAARDGVPDPKDFPDETADQGGGVGGDFSGGDVSAASGDQVFPGGMVARGLSPEGAAKLRENLIHMGYDPNEDPDKQHAADFAERNAGPGAWANLVEGARGVLGSIPADFNPDAYASPPAVDPEATNYKPKDYESDFRDKLGMGPRRISLAELTGIKDPHATFSGKGPVFNDQKRTWDDRPAGGLKAIGSATERETKPLADKLAGYGEAAARGSRPTADLLDAFGGYLQRSTSDIPDAAAKATQAISDFFTKKRFQNDEE